MKDITKLLSFAFLFLAASNASSQNGPVRPDLEARRLAPPSESIGPLGNDLFGDQIDRYTGQTSFSVTDIDIPGISNLPVRLTRTYSVQEWDGFSPAVAMGNWDVEVPVIEGTFSSDGWVVEGSNPNLRCSQGSGAPKPYVDSTTSWMFYADDFWSGYTLKIPGRSDQKLLLSTPTTPNKSPPARWTTTDNWLVECIPGLKNGGAGEGFLVTAPDGTKYSFDLMVSQSSPFKLTGIKDLAYTIHDAPISSGTGVCRSSVVETYEVCTINIWPTINNNPYEFLNELDGAGGGGGGSCALGMGTIEERSYWDGGSLDCLNNGTTDLNVYSKLTRISVHLVATTVTDRHGNTVNYGYDVNNRLSSIQSSDGRLISLTRNSNNQIATASAHGKTWNYQYGAEPSSIISRTALEKVILPDTRYWQYAITGVLKTPYLWDVTDPEVNADICANNSLQNQNTILTDRSVWLKFTHPSGALGQFVLSPRFQGKSNADECENMAIQQFSIASKVIEGAGLARAEWKFTYGPENSSLRTYGGSNPDALASVVDCSLTACVRTVSTEIVNPDGTVEKLLFGTDLKANDGKLLRMQAFKSSVLQSETTFEYVPYNSSNVGFISRVGINPSVEPDNLKAEHVSPLKRSVQVQEGVTYTNQVNAFDAFARPIDVTRSNSNGYSKTELTQYVDNTSKWVLGQVGSVADVSTGLIEQSNTYDPVNANLLSKSAFGVLQESYTYNADGTLATVKDGKNNTYILANWKRGIPQLITAPNSTTQSGVVNDSGWLTAVTNQRGYTTGYAYDPMGRLSSITPPTGDTVVWAGTTLTFTPLTAATYGVPAGGWKHSISRGNYRKETYMDALYRPLVIREYDNGNVAGTERFTVKAYDTLNREVFSSYPGKTAGLTVGVRTEYDALGRVTATKADSELGVLTTTTEYLAGGGIKVTGPDGNITTRSFRSLDAPSYEQMISEAAPGGVTTSISRDVFGKPLTITRSGTDGLSISKQFAYDANQRLCMRTEPETGTSIIDYDAAGNVLWAANGQAVANPAMCNRAAAVAGAKINYTYDTLNRVTGTDVPGSTNDPTVTYLPDGAVNTLSNGTATWTYTYNRLGKPVTESLNLGGKISTLTHAYDTLANEASLTYPNGTAVSYTPNALGQSTQVGTYATGMTYRASGFLSAMTYGNGATYSALPNLRGLPARRLDSKGTTVINDELMAFDPDANPVCVRDSSAGNPGSRDFAYDARDRLIKVSAPNQGWISAEYQYDSQDNLQMARLGTRQYNYSYTNLNRLSEIGQPASAPVATNFGLLSCTDAALLADIDSSTPGTGGGTGGSGGSGGSLVLSPATLDDGMVDEPYSQILGTNGGTAPYTYALSSGNLPFGLSLSGNTISGAPSVEVSKTFTITSTDSLGATGSQSYTLEILPSGGGGNEPLRVSEPLAGGVVMALAAGDTLKYAFSHDAQGRMTQKGTQAYVFDALNRMTQVTGKESYLYDGHGRRVQVTKTSDSKKNYPLYGLDGKLLVEDNRQTLKRTEYIYAGSRLIAKRIQPITAAGANNGTATVTTIHTDFLGSPVAETNSAGTVTRVERYTPYGEPSDMQLDVGPGFTGHATDVATGLTYMQQRYYDADIGRFISPDPVGPEEDFIKHFNRYNYAQNNPARYTDPDGRESGCITVGTNCGFGGVSQADLKSRVSAVADFIPGISDLKAVYDAYKNPSLVNILGAVVGVVPGLGDGGAKVIKNADDLFDLARLPGSNPVKRGREISIQGNIDEIYDEITAGGKQIGGGRVQLPDGTIVGRHQPTKGAKHPTIDVHKGGRQHKIRIEPPPPPPKKPGE